MADYRSVISLLIMKSLPLKIIASAVCIIAITALCFIRFYHSSQPLAIPNDSPNDQIFEATIRYVIEHNGSAVQMGSRSFFVSINGKDPEQKFLKRFKYTNVAIKPGSEFKTGNGLSFNAYNMKWINATEVTLSASYYEGNLSSAEYTVSMLLIHNKWSIVKYAMNWVS